MASENADKNAGDSYFVLENGRQVHSIRQLHQELEGMTDALFNSYQQRKDFGNWIQVVYGEHILARRLNHCKTKEAFSADLEDWLKPNGYPVRTTRLVHWLRQREDDLMMDLLCFALGVIVGTLVTLMIVRL